MLVGLLGFGGLVVLATAGLLRLGSEALFGSRGSVLLAAHVVCGGLTALYHVLAARERASLGGS